MQVTTTIAAAPERVWDLLIDPSRFPEWQASTVQVVTADERLDHVGAAFTAISRLRSRQAGSTGATSQSGNTSAWRTRMVPSTLRTTNWLQGKWQVTRIVPGRLLVLTGTAPAGARGTITQQIEESVGRVAYTIAMTYVLPAGFLGTVADRMFVERVLERDFQESGQNLNRLLMSEEP